MTVYNNSFSATTGHPTAWQKFFYFKTRCRPNGT